MSRDSDDFEVVIVSDSMFPDTEAATGKADQTTVTHAAWHAAYDKLTNEQRVEVLDMVNSYLEFSREDQTRLVAAFTGPELRYAVRQGKRL